jgi:hypothetical protein
VAILSLTQALLYTWFPISSQIKSTYFIPKTIKFKLEYQHLAPNFAPHLLPTHLLHPQKTLFYHNLNHFQQIYNSHPSPRLLYTLIITMRPSLDTCELTLHHLPNPPFVHFILIHLSQLFTSLETRIQILHPFDIF